MRSGVVDSNPWDGQKLKDSKSRVQRRPLTEPELQKLIQYATRSDLILDVGRTLALSGMRVAEAANLTVADILTPPQFDITTAKTVSGTKRLPADAGRFIDVVLQILKYDVVCDGTAGG